MSKVQTRRNISLHADLYDRFAAWCEAEGIPKSRKIEEILDAFFGGPPPDPDANFEWRGRARTSSPGVNASAASAVDVNDPFGDGADDAGDLRGV